jgi:methionyl aminopeptidase
LAIELKSDAEIEIMRESGAILCEVLDTVIDAVQPGVREVEIDALVRDEFRRRDVIPTFLGYHGYPATVCISVNEKIVHGIPGRRPFREGDLVSIDLGLTHRGFVADSARSVACGEASDEVNLLVATAREALDAGIAQTRAGNRLGDVGHAIQQTAENRGFSVVRGYVGHGVGREMHEEPQVPGYGTPGRGVAIRKGMVLALEPMVNAGTHETRVDLDDWTVRTADDRLSAHFEHTVAVTANGPEVLTDPRHPANAAVRAQAVAAR